MRTLLCVDDDHWVLETIKDALAAKGLRVLGTTSPEEAPSFLRQVKIDLVLLDLNLPRTDGYAVYREIEKIADVPVLFISGTRAPAARCRPDTTTPCLPGFDRPLQDFLAKPFSLDDLYTKVEQLMGEPIAA